MSSTALASAGAQFECAYPSAVRSVRQATLLQAWLEQRPRCRALPILDEFTALNAYPNQAELTIYDVVRKHAIQRYRVAKEGSQFRTAFATTGRGQFLDEVIPLPVWRGTQSNFDACVRRGLPIYCELSAFEISDQNVIYERLLLPFGDDTGEVNSIVSSLKTTSWANVEAPLANLNGGAPKYNLRAVISLDGPTPS